MKKEFWLIVLLAIIIVVLTAAAFLPKEWFGKIIPGIKSTEVKVTSVQAGQEIETPLVVEGEAKGTWFFEGDFPIKITDEHGNVLGTSYVQAQDEWMTEDFVAFKGEIRYASKTGGKGFLVLAKDNPSGLPEYDKEIKIPIVLQKTGYTTIKAYFSNSQMNPDTNPCDQVFAVDREIKKIEAIGSAALWKLLMGLTDEEKEQGYFTSINSGVKLNGLDVRENGVAIADFDEQLEYQVGGSCRVSSIRAQITETLKQFPTVNEVIISINGRTQDILQP